MKNTVKAVSCTVAVISMLILPATAHAARTHPTVNYLGNDISWPQCGKRLPTNQAFGIVGVNGGLANTTNACLTEQLIWASRSTGAVALQPKIQLYVNTANPGGLNTPSWPKNNVGPDGVLSPNPSECKIGIDGVNGEDSIACAWQYGWNRAVEDVIDRFVPAAQATKSPTIYTNPANYTWWLDVETVNTWKTGDIGKLSNAAVLEGMVAYFNSKLGAKVGIYSTSYQWGLIVGNTSTTSNLNGLDSWLAGASSTSAASFCAKPPLTVGGRVVLAQYVSKNLDYDYSCI